MASWEWGEAEEEPGVEPGVEESVEGWGWEAVGRCKLNSVDLTHTVA